MTKGLAILSGGADSATLIYELKDNGHEIQTLTFDYGQRHRRELQAATAVARAAGVTNEIIDLSCLGPVLSGSALTGGVDIPHGHYKEETMRLTVVPNRNAIMLSIAWGIATARQCGFIAYGAHAGDHYIYPDCRPEFCEAIVKAFQLATIKADKPHDRMMLYVPFIEMSKSDIIKRGIELGVPYELTWTCYEGGEQPCGMCGACNERAEAFKEAGAIDPTVTARAA